MSAVAAVAPPLRILRVALDVPDTEWDEYVAGRPDASAYHQSAWARLLGRVFQHDVCLLAVTAEGGVTGVLPLIGFRSRMFGRFAISLPFVNYGGVLADDEASASALLAAAIDVSRGWRASYLELRHTRQQFPALRARRHKVAMTMPLLASPDAQWQALDRKIRNQVRKAEKSGVTVSVGGIESVDAFYRVFSHNMRDLGTPVYPQRLFKEMLSTFPDTTRIFTASLDGEPVAAAVTLAFRDRLEVPVASSVRDLRALCPNILLYWEIIRHAVASGYRVFDFGRSTPGEGTFHFKRQWGAVPAEMVWEYWTSGDAPLPDLSPHNPKYQRAVALWRRLPITVANTIGPRIVRNLP